MEKMWKKIPRPSAKGFGAQQSQADNARTQQNAGPAYGQPAQPVSRKAVISMAPSVSSVYSQPSNYDWNEANRHTVASSYYGDDVSPPDSPVRTTSGNVGDVSPVEQSSESDIHPAFRIKQKPVGGSNIPVRRKATPAENAASSPSRAYNRDLSVPLRWDKYSGEPTTNKSRGLPSTVKPENVVQGINQHKLRSASNASQTSEEDLDIDTKPPWRGASGRVAIVAPVIDNPGQKAPVPNRENRKPIGIEIPSPTYASPIQGPREMPSVTTLKQEDPVTPTMDSFPRPGTAQQINKQKTVRPVEDERFDTPDQSTEMQTPTVPDSRFSWTTQATNTTYKQSPPESPENVPPVPNLPGEYQDSSIMSRSRPIPTSKNLYSPEDSPISTPTDGRIPRDFLTVGVSNNLARGPSIRSPSISSSAAPQKGPDKALPPTPQELDSSDHVAVLQAQLDDLATQRRNVERLLSDLTRPEASNPMNTNFKIEREREKRVAALKGELNEIEMARHDIGLKLHRANRRQEREQGYEGFTTLWVRRVTS